jgi:hypothetical protein
MKEWLLRITGEEPAASGQRKDQMEARRETLKKRRRYAEARTIALYTFGVLTLLVGTPFLVRFLEFGEALAYLGAFGIGFLLMALFLRQRERQLNEEITEIGNDLDLIDLNGDEREHRATKLLQGNQFDLRRYYEQTLRQGNQIFYVGVFCIMVGFGIIGVAFWLITDGPASELSDKIVVAALGAIGGVLANFIALIYLKMFDQTNRAVGEFHHRLVIRDRVNFGNILAAKIDTPSTREATLAQMARQLAVVNDVESVMIPMSSNGTSPNGVPTSGSPV